MTRPTIGLLLTLALSLLVAPLAAEAQPPKHVHRIGVLAGTTISETEAQQAHRSGARASAAAPRVRAAPRGD